MPNGRVTPTQRQRTGRDTPRRRPPGPSPRRGPPTRDDLQRRLGNQGTLEMMAGRAGGETSRPATAPEPSAGAAVMSEATSAAPSPAVSEGREPTVMPTGGRRAEPTGTAASPVEAAAPVET